MTNLSPHLREQPAQQASASREATGVELGEAYADDEADPHGGDHELVLGSNSIEKI